MPNDSQASNGLMNIGYGVELHFWYGRNCDFRIEDETAQYIGSSKNMELAGDRVTKEKRFVPKPSLNWRWYLREEPLGSRTD